MSEGSGTALCGRTLAGAADELGRVDLHEAL